MWGFLNFDFYDTENIYASLLLGLFVWKYQRRFEIVVLKLVLKFVVSSYGGGMESHKGIVQRDHGSEDGYIRRNCRSWRPTDEGRTDHHAAERWQVAACRRPGRQRRSIRSSGDSPPWSRFVQGEGCGRRGRRYSTFGVTKLGLTICHLGQTV